MNSKIFIDSSIFIESFKGNKVAKEILEVAVDKYEIYINDIVFSEVVFKLLGIKSGKSPLTLKKSQNIPLIVDGLRDYIELLTLSDLLMVNMEILKTSINFMKKYNLLSNDAIILSTCKYYKIELLASLDRDFESILPQENMILVNSPEILT
ncbi:type II toxin-antitoxin system VapC family toxin [Persephonella sp.]